MNLIDAIFNTVFLFNSQIALTFNFYNIQINTFTICHHKSVFICLDIYWFPYLLHTKCFSIKKRKMASVTFWLKIFKFELRKRFSSTHLLFVLLVRCNFFNWPSVWDTVTNLSPHFPPNRLSWKTTDVFHSVINLWSLTALWTYESGESQGVSFLFRPESLSCDGGEEISVIYVQLKWGRLGNTSDELVVMLRSHRLRKSTFKWPLPMISQC